jgi:hypothetical protein
MTFDNSKTIIGVRIKLFFATVFMLTWVALVYIAKLITFPLLGVYDSVWTLILVIIYLSLAFLPNILNYQFVSYNDEGENIVLRFFTAGIVGGKKNSVEINKNLFAGYRIESKLFGFRRNLILYQKLGQGIAKFPPIYISALSLEQRTKLNKALGTFGPVL